MYEDRGPLEHYRGLSLSSVSEHQRKEALAKIIRQGKAIEDADQAERQRRTDELHAIFMKGFRDSISGDDRFTDEEKAKIIKASYEW
jgi:hypothetical protein